MKESLYNFPTKRDFVLAGIAAFILLHQTPSSSKPEELPIVIPTPIQAPVYHPFVGPLLNAVRKQCRDVGVNGYLTGQNKCLKMEFKHQ